MGVAMPAHAQVSTDSVPSSDTTVRRAPAGDTAVALVKKKPRIHRDSAGKIIPDSLWKKRADSIARFRALHRDSSTRPNYTPDRLSDTVSRVSSRDTGSTALPDPPPHSDYRPVTGWMKSLSADPWFNFAGPARRIRDLRHHSRSDDLLFYLLVALLFFFAIVKLFYGKYLGNLLTLFFRVSMRQQQIREQVLQFPFPSLLLNLLFFLSGGLFGSFLMRQYHYGSEDEIWSLFALGTIFLVVIYLVKYILLRLAAWIFNIPRAVETYLFIVFMTNKIIGIFLLPVLVILSFADPVISSVAFTVAIIMILVFYGYRVAGTFSSLKKEIKFSRIHFFLYLCAFEIAPVLLIYKVLLTYIARAF